MKRSLEKINEDFIYGSNKSVIKFLLRWHEKIITFITLIGSNYENISYSLIYFNFFHPALINNLKS